jgi:hypothetical protein
MDEHEIKIVLSNKLPETDISVMADEREKEHFGHALREFVIG